MRVRPPKWLQHIFPMAGWLPDTDASDLHRDLVAGLTVGVMMVPQGMAYAVLAGLPPIYGLYASLVPLLVYPLLGTSRQLITGPIAIDMLIVAAGVGALATPGSSEYVALAIALAAAVGVVQIAMGTLRLGFVADLLSRPVIAGFTHAAALIIAISQLGSLLGVEVERTSNLVALAATVVQNLNGVHGPTLGVGLACIAGFAGLTVWRPNWPAALVVTIAVTAASWGFGLPSMGIEIVGDVPRGFPMPTVPDVSWGDLWALGPTALTLALVQFMSVVSLGRVFAKRHGYAIEPNRELFAIGAANLVGSLVRSIPVSGSFSRSAVNDQAGGTTPLANVVAAAVIAGALIVLTPLVRFIPMPALAALIIVSAFGLINLDEIRALFETRRREAAIAGLTFLATLLVGIQAGILLGVGASIVAVLYRLSRPNMAELGHVRGTRTYRDRHRIDDAVPIDGVLVLRVNAAFSFANAERFKDFILSKSRAEADHIDAVVIDGSSINDIDTTAMEALDAILDVLDDEDVALYFAGLVGPVRDLLRRSGIWDRLGDDHFYRHPHEAITHILAALDADDDGVRLDDYLDTTGVPEPEAEAKHKTA